MCLLATGDANYGDSGLCLMSVGAYALNEVTDFVIMLDKQNVEGDYTLWLGQRMAGKLVGALGYAAIMVVAIVECVAIFVIGLLALLPAGALDICFRKGYFIAVGISVFMAGASLLDLPVRCVSGVVQNVLLGQRKDFEELSISAICTRSRLLQQEDRFAARRAEAAQRAQAVQHPEEMP
jgi:hypothetical protein